MLFIFIHHKKVRMDKQSAKAVVYGPELPDSFVRNRLTADEGKGDFESKV